jgi:tetrahydromethanopterin S-methyltransferase subunit G
MKKPKTFWKGVGALIGFLFGSVAGLVIVYLIAKAIKLAIVNHW